MKVNDKNQKFSIVVWAVVGASFGAIIGIIAYNNQWLS